MMKLAHVSFNLMGFLLLLGWRFIEGSEAKSCIEYVKVGCYKDSLRKPRPLPMLIERYRPGLNWSFPEHLISSGVLSCAKAVSKKGYTIFGLQYYGECWSGENAIQTYARDGRSCQCLSAVNKKFKPCNNETNELCIGAARANFIYKIIGPVDGAFSAWSGWSSCSKTCGGGQKRRTRSCNNPGPSKCGKPCIGNTKEVTDCNTHCCPVDGAFSAWSGWSSCSKTCGGGQKRRTRSCNNPGPSKCGKPCIGNTKEVTDCNTHSCPEPCEDKSLYNCKIYKEWGLCRSQPLVRRDCKRSCGTCP